MLLSFYSDDWKCGKSTLSCIYYEKKISFKCMMHNFPRKNCAIFDSFWFFFLKKISARNNKRNNNKLFVEVSVYASLVANKHLFIYFGYV